MGDVLLGVALTVGPNYNLPMMAEPRAAVAWEALQQAQQHAAATTPVERALIDAGGKRYQSPQPLDPSNADEDKLAYSEPADWFFPSRHLLGAVLIRVGRPAEAEAVYLADLGRHPNNGWALHGLAQSLQMQGRGADAAGAQQRFDAAWKNADVVLAASAL